MASPLQDEQSQHEMKDQMMQMRQELNDAHTKVVYQLLHCVAQLEETAEMSQAEGLGGGHALPPPQFLTPCNSPETESCMKAVEVVSFKKIKLLCQLISHNKNVERAVALRQQCLVEQKKAQSNEMEDWKQRTVILATNHDELENLALKIQNKLLVAQINQLRKEKGKKMSKTQTIEGEVQVQKLEVYVRDVQTQLNQEKRELTAKLSHCNLFLKDSHCSQELQLRIAECKTTKLAVMNEAKKQLIMTQLLSVQTELTKSIEESHQKTERYEELQKELKLESEEQSSNELETNSSEDMTTKLKMYSIKSNENGGQPTSNKIEIETLTTRIQEFKEANNDLETRFGEVKTETTEEITKSINEAECFKKLLDAKIEDMDDRLWLGMVKLQQAIDDFKKGITEKTEDEACKRESDLKKLQEGQEKAEKMTEELKKIVKKIYTACTVNFFINLVVATVSLLILVLSPN